MYNIGIVGCGYWGPNLVRNFNTLEGSQVKIACDLDADRLAHMKSLYPTLETRSDYNLVVNSSEIDAIVVATPVRFHYEIAKASLEAGKHVFIEKPMASSVEECMELIEIAEERKLTILVGHTFIYSPAVRRIREIVSHGDLGEIQYISARRLNLGLFQTDINVTWDLAPHDISIILYVMGKSPVSVNCHGKAHVNRNIEDITSMVLSFENGAFATVQSSWLDPNKVREMTFVGSKRMLVYNDVEPIEKIKIYDKRVETPPHYDTFAEFHYSYHYGDMYAPYLKQYEPLKVECQHFIDCIKSGKKPETSGYDGYRVVEILEASLESIRREGAKILIGDSRIQRPARLQSVANLSAARVV